TGTTRSSGGCPAISAASPWKSPSSPRARRSEPAAQDGSDRLGDPLPDDVPRLAPLREPDDPALRVAQHHVAIARLPGNEEDVRRLGLPRFGLGAGLLALERVSVFADLVGELGRQRIRAGVLAPPVRRE